MRMSGKCDNPLTSRRTDGGENHIKKPLKKLHLPAKMCISFPCGLFIIKYTSAAGEDKYFKTQS